jgi:hypothetical protein
MEGGENESSLIAIYPIGKNLGKITQDHVLEYLQEFILFLQHFK